MKVLLITRTLAEFASLQGKIQEMSKLDVELTVLSPSRWAGADREVRRLVPDGYKLLLHNCCFSGTACVRLGNHFHFYPRIADVIAGEQWDLVHIDEEPFNVATYHALRQCRKYGRTTAFSTWQNLMKRYPPPFHFFERYVYANADAAIAGSDEALGVLRKRGFMKCAAQIPHLGVDPNVFRLRDASDVRRELRAEHSFTVGFIGRLVAEKGVDTLVNAFTALSPASVLVIMGSGPEQAKLKALVKTLGLSARVRWVPWVPSDQVAVYMNALDVLVLPSRTCRHWKEQFGRVLVEAMASGTCVVGSNSGEIPKTIGQDGLVFPEGNVSGLADCLRRLMWSPSLRATLRRRGHDRVLTHYAYSRIAGETVDFYRTICDSKRHSESTSLSMVSA